MKEFRRRKIQEALEKGDYRALSLLCLELLQVDDWPEGWRKMNMLVETSGEYVLAKFMASAYALYKLYDVLSPATREFIARDVVICLEKTAQVIDTLSQQGGFGDIHGQLNA